MACVFLRRDDFTLTRSGTIPIDAVRRHVAQDLAGDVARLLASDATFQGRPVQAGDVAVLIYSLKHAAQFQAELHERGIPSVVSGGSSVLLTEAAQEWLTLLEALEQPHRSGRVRAVALTSFVGISAEELDRGGDDLDLIEELGEIVDAGLLLLDDRDLLGGDDGDAGTVLHDIAGRTVDGLGGLDGLGGGATTLIVRLLATTAGGGERHHQDDEEPAHGENLIRRRAIVEPPHAP